MALMAKISCLLLALAALGAGPALGAEQAAPPAISTADFSGTESGDFKELARFLANKGPRFPVSWRLKPEIREFLIFWHGQEVPEEMRRAITAELNVMLSDRFLFKDIMMFYKRYSPGRDNPGSNNPIRDPRTEVFAPEDRRLLCWLVRLLEAEGIFDRKQTDIPPLASAQLHALNRILLMGISRKRLPPAAEGPFSPPSDVDVLLSPTRLAMLRPKRVVDYLKIQPGMVIADIGAGYGTFTFPMADALRDAGRIYATDISSDAISYLGTRAKSDGYEKVTAVPVIRNGVDPFYKQHVFDMILAAEVYVDIEDPIPYFNELRLSLKPGTGRLCIIHTDADPDFTELEFGDFKDVIKTLAAKGERFPVYKRLRPETREHLKSWRGKKVPAGLRREIIADFNALLAERSLFDELEDFHDDSALIGGYHLASWLVTQLRAEGVFARESRPISPLGRKELHALNRILLTRIFPTRAWSDALMSDFALITDKETVVKQVSAAGYTLIRDNDKLLPYFHVLEFQRAR